MKFTIGVTEFDTYADAFKAAQSAIEKGEKDLTFEEVKKRGGKFAFKVIRLADAKPLDDGRPDVVPEREGESS